MVLGIGAVLGVGVGLAGIQDPVGAKPPSQGEREWVVAGRVLEAGSGRPIAGAEVGLLLPKVPWGWMLASAAEARSDRGGRFAAKAVFPGAWLLVASKTSDEAVRPGFHRPFPPPAYGDAWLPVTVGPADEGVSGLEILLGPPATLQVTARDEAENALESTSVVALRRDVDHPTQFLIRSLYTTATGGDGRTEVLGLGKGRYEVLAFKKGWGAGRLDGVDLDWGETKAVAVTIERGGDLYVRAVAIAEERRRVLDRSGWGAGLCEIRDERGRLVSLGPFAPWLWGFENMDQIPPAPEDPTLLYAGTYAPGRYRVLFRVPRGHAETSAEFVSLAPESTVDVEIVPGRDARVEVVIDVGPPR